MKLTTTKPYINLEITEEIIKTHTIKSGLYPTKQKLSIPIIKRIYKKMINDLKFDEIKVHDDMIIDGHNRYVSSLLAGRVVDKIKIDKTSATKRYKWEDAAFVNEEWDTPEKINKLNNDDATFNNLTIEVIIEMTK